MTGKAKKKEREMRFFFMGPRILGIRPGISFSASELLRLAAKPKQNNMKQLVELGLKAKK